MRLKGNIVMLEPMAKQEIPQFYYWAIRSPFWYGKYSDEKEIPTYDQFRKDWQDFYFDGSAPEKGRSFVIVTGERAVGQINYNKIDRNDQSVDLDIIIYQEKDRGKGYGPDALRTLCNYLFSEMGVKKCELATAVNNERAIESYKKAGFKAVGPTFSKGVEFLKMELRQKSLVEAG